ncbi:class II 3-deoxy-7-phosphoheptulonate synthase [Natronospira bacteriovora]|uniref:Phospho-2-dehydro-3-deoxyheptonate aldolase n=1 Tax=Natronospira bacteriovora TaxID=3069753 RepID=A0ABU0W9T6_9GAMM|nr:3-deoxy-7-phosphoheptulonate synthase class II [Natronospira sp. AB-CW4]MDQ2070761.1 3-deoxy-7-phosphoheptulonate synthase class II [Natronospira sp. AB-CW4]
MNHQKNNDWSPESWQRKAAGQQPLYRDPEQVDSVVARLNRLPQLVTHGEIEALKQQLAEASRGERFLLQGGDCAESFDDCTAENIANKLKILLQMSLVLVTGMRKRITRVGRIAGQYAKPRSADTETRDGVTLPSYRGDLINRSPFTAEDREPDPELMLRGYERAALTLNHIRALVDGGFADLHHPENWDLDFVRSSAMKQEYRRIVDSVLDSLQFMETIAGGRVSGSGRVDFFTSHEALQLHYEQAQTHRVRANGRWYNMSTHFPWIGMRTAELDGAHIEYFRGIANPIAVKVGPGMSPETLKELVRVLNPDNEAGRLTLIHRLGASRIKELLPPMIEAVQSTGRSVLWTCDPMHGNTETTQSGIKTRRVENVFSELEQAFHLHEANDSHLGGVHIELTGENVTECLGGASGLTEQDLEKAYRSQVDPRLNYDQALELAMRVAGYRLRESDHRVA